MDLKNFIDAHDNYIVILKQADLIVKKKKNYY